MIIFLMSERLRCKKTVRNAIFEPFIGITNPLNESLTEKTVGIFEASTLEFDHMQSLMLKDILIWNQKCLI